MDELYEEAKQAQARSVPLQRARRRWQEIKENGAVTRTQESYLEHYDIQEDRMYRKDGNKKKLVVPLAFINKMTAFFHDEDHPGAKETIRRLKKRFYCRGMDRKVYTYVRDCLACAQTKAQQRQEIAPLRAYKPTVPFQMLSIDILGPYLKTPNNNRYILAIEDMFSKWVEIKAFPEIKVKTVLTYLEEEIIPRYGPPRQIVSDHGGAFVSGSFRKWCQDRGIESRPCAVGHQQANPVERRVQEIKKLLRLFTKDQREDKWDEHLHKVAMALRKRRNEATGATPSKIVLGYELPEYGESMSTDPREDENDRRTFLENVNRNLEAYQQKYAPDDRPALIILRPGQRVLVRNKDRKKNVFRCPWLGPFSVNRKISDEVYEIERNGTITKLHINDLRLAPRGHPNHVNEHDPDGLERQDEDRNGPPGVENDPPPAPPLEQGEVETPDYRILGPSRKQEPVDHRLRRQPRRKEDS